VRRHLERAEQLNPAFIVVDTPPALGPATRAAAEAAAYVLIPSEPGKESLLRAHDIVTIALESPTPPIIRILLTKVNPQTNLYRWMVENVDELYPTLRSPRTIPNETAAAESAIFDRPVTVSAPRSRSAMAYCDVAADILRVFEREVSRLDTGAVA
jgi:chromosome partitioning protein